MVACLGMRMLPVGTESATQVGWTRQDAGRSRVEKTIIATKPARSASLVRARARGGPVPQFATPGAIGGSSQQPGGGMAKTSDVTRARKAAAPVPIEIRLAEAVQA